MFKNIFSLIKIVTQIMEDYDKNNVFEDFTILDSEDESSMIIQSSSIEDDKDNCHSQLNNIFSYNNDLYSRVYKDEYDHNYRHSTAVCQGLLSFQNDENNYKSRFGTLSETNLNTFNKTKTNNKDDFLNIIKSLPLAPHSRNNSHNITLPVYKKNHENLSQEEIDKYIRMNKKLILDPKIIWFIIPIVGEYHEGKLNITACFDKSDQDIAIIYKSTNHTSGIWIRCIEKNTFTITLENLKPDTEYEVDWYLKNNGMCIYKHQIRTGNIEKMFFVSNDNINVDSQISLWNTIQDNIMQGSKRSSLIHIGNQIYGDDVYKHCLRNKCSIQETCNLYLNKYSETFKERHEIYSNINNIMSWNDREITKNFVYDLISDDSDEKNVAKGAYESYKMIQENLHVNVLFVKERCWIKKYEENSVMIFIENISSDLTINEIIAIIEVAFVKYNPQNVIIMFSKVPLPPPESKLYNFFYSNRKYFIKSDIIELYKYLLDWLSYDKKRSLFVIGGDINYGFLGTVLREDIQFHIASPGPITNQPTIKDKIASTKLLGIHDINEDIKMFIIESKSRRGYVTLVKDRYQKLIPNIHYSSCILPKDKLKYLKHKLL